MDGRGAVGKNAPLKVPLGIDWGSTGVRLMFYLQHQPTVATFVPLWNKDTPDWMDKRYGGGAYKSTITPFDHGPVYTTDKEARGREKISSKFTFGMATGLDSNNPTWRRLAELWEDPEFRRLCKSGMEDIVDTFARATENACNKNNWEISDIGLSIPATWTSEEIQEYTRLMKKSFGRSRTMRQALKHIHFITEVESFAHYLMWNMRAYGELSLGSTDASVLLLDFGGFSMSGCRFQVRKAKGVAEAFFREGEPFGVAGGTEHWEAHVSKYCTDHAFEESYAGEQRTKLAESTRAQLLDDFHRTIIEGDHQYFEEMRLRVDIIDSYNLGRRYVTVTVPRESSEDLFNKATGRSIEMAEEKIGELGVFARSGANVKVVVTGGSAKHFRVQSRLRDACNRAGLEDALIFVHDRANIHAAFNVARGAALAASNTSTVDRFMGNGAAFCIQMMQEDNPGQLWDDTAKIVLTEYGSHPLNFESTGEERLKIICDPFHSGKKRTGRIHHTKCYDVVELPAPPKENWKYTLELDGNPGDADVDLTLMRLQMENGTPVNNAPALQMRLSFDRSANCYLINVGDQRVENAHRGLAITEDGTYVACYEEPPVSPQTWTVLSPQKRTALSQQATAAAAALEEMEMSNKVSRVRYGPQEVTPSPSTHASPSSRDIKNLSGRTKPSGRLQPYKKKVSGDSSRVAKPEGSRSNGMSARLADVATETLARGGGMGPVSSPLASRGYY